MTTAKIVDTTNKTEIKGRVMFVTRWTASGTDVLETLTDAQARGLPGGTSRAALADAIREAEKTNASGNRGHAVVYVRDTADADGAIWWPVEIAG